MAYGQRGNGFMFFLVEGVGPAAFWYCAWILDVSHQAVDQWSKNTGTYWNSKNADLFEDGGAPRNGPRLQYVHHGRFAGGSRDLSQLDTFELICEPGHGQGEHIAFEPCLKELKNVRIKKDNHF